MYRVTILLFVPLAFGPMVSASFWDQIPVVSQIKSLVQVIGGDNEGAAETQENFTRGIFLPAPVIRSIVETANGDSEEARNTWKQVGSSYNAMVDSVPVVGHAKGAIHYAAGDGAGGDNAMRSASRTTGVAAGGVTGFLAGGPAGAVAGGIAGGAVADGVITGVESAINNEFVPNGHIRNIHDITTGKVSPGKIFDTAADFVGDGVGGYTMGKSGASLISRPGNSLPSRSGTSSYSRVQGDFHAPGKISCFVQCNTNYYRRPSTFSNTNIQPWQPAVIPKPSISIRPQGLFPNPGVSMPAKLSPNLENVGRTLVKTNSNLIPKKSAGAPISLPSLSVSSVPVSGAVGSIVSSRQATNPAKVLKSKRKRTAECERPPNIANADTQRMQRCAGSRPGQRCLIECLHNYEPSKKSVECEAMSQGGAQWNTLGAECRLSTDAVCRDNYNRRVDWFVIYKLPKKVDGGSLPVITNSNYFFITSEPVDKWDFKDDDEFLEHEWKSWTAWITGNQFSGRDGCPALDFTLSILNDSSVTYAMYNDQPPPTNRADSRFGHSKGVAAKRGMNGFYLVHSLPGFPSPPGNSRPKSWKERNGQLIICVSVNAQTQWSNIAQHVTNLNPKIYSSRNWENLNINQPGGNYQLTYIRSKAGMKFDLFSKGYGEIEIYRDVLSPHYGVSLNVLTWSNGRGTKLPSERIGTRKIQNIKKLKHGQDWDASETQAEWGGSKEHSKWAVSTETDDTDLFCASDLNRMRSQMTRKGGVICFVSEKVASAFRLMIAEVEPAV